MNHGRALEDCLHLVDEAIGNVRQMSQLLRPTILDDFGLEAGLRWLGEGFAARTGIEANFDSSFSGRLPDETETHLFRIAQEALTNVARHSGAQAREDQTGSARAANPAFASRTTAADFERPLPADRPRHGYDRHARPRPQRRRRCHGPLPAGRGVLIEVRVPLRT